VKKKEETTSTTFINYENEIEFLNKMRKELKQKEKNEPLFIVEKKRVGEEETNQITNSQKSNNNQSNNNNLEGIKQGKVVISAHGDTNFPGHTMLLNKVANRMQYFGHQDNFAGVYIVMNALFSGKLTPKKIRIEITYKEETTMEGAREVAKTLDKSNIVIVLDVTGTVTTKNFVIEKCRNKRLRQFIIKELDMHKDLFSYDIYSGCPDMICDQDETNVYGKITDYTFFFGIPTRHGDYNEGEVLCYQEDIEKCVTGLIVLSNALVNFPIFKEEVASSVVFEGEDSNSISNLFS